MYKVNKGMSHPYNLRHNAEFLQPLVNSVRCGTERISYLGQKFGV